MPKRTKELLAEAESEGGPDPVGAPTLRHQAYERLERMIVQGQLRPGNRLPETDLARLLGVSRGPIREALQLLERDGWVETRARHGAIVRRRSPREIQELYETRGVLEAQAARLAARQASEADRARLVALMAESEAVLAAGDTEALIAANAAVHNCFSDICGNRTLAEMVHALGRRVRWYSMTPRTPERAPAALAEHRTIVHAILDRNEARAAEAMARRTANDLAAYLGWLRDNPDSAGSDSKA